LPLVLVGVLALLRLLVLVDLQVELLLALD
jgi:hypothetical protein